jgi:uncharacterized RmlC-like cupin family protein
MDRVPRCTLVRSATRLRGRQGLDYSVGISAESAGSVALHLQELTIPPGGRGKAHKHAEHETAIHALSGRSGCWFGDALEGHVWVEAGDYFYIPPDTPHVPYNPSATEAFVAIIARTDANEQESVTLLPELDAVLADRDWPVPDHGTADLATLRRTLI